MTPSIWPSASAPGEPLGTDADVPVAIIGAGIAGLTVAYALAQRGIHAVILDAGAPGEGQTHYTSAHLASVIDDRFVSMEKWHGAEGSRLACQSHAAAIDFIEEIVKRHGISCEFERVEGHLFAADPKDIPFLREELRAARRAGHVDAEWVSGVPLGGLESRAAIRFPRQARFNPGLYLKGLLQAVVEAGVRIFPRTRVLSWKENNGIILKTERGNSVHCKMAVAACNDPFVRFRYYVLHAPYRSYVSVFNVSEGDAADGLFWDTADPYHYLRFATAPDGRGKVLLAGGEDHKTGQAGDEAASWERLEAWTRKTLPFVRERIMNWSGQILETCDGLAFIGADPGGKGKMFLVSGDSGMGLTHGTIAGLLLPDLMSGRSHAWEKIYDPGRLRLKALPHVIEENANVMAQYAHHLKAGCSAHCPLTEEGVVVQKGLQKIARVRTDEGKEIELSAVCPHLGGLVEWNSAERTWDCECHGSRFTADGAVICGPAVTPLQPVGAGK
jgi:glycine/D-amino acid oxidase-like deaminating enzyme/nitrite reductase/ring-hydroxylating ferredoxin subunit